MCKMIGGGGGGVVIVTIMSPRIYNQLFYSSQERRNQTLALEGACHDFTYPESWSHLLIFGEGRGS